MRLNTFQPKPPQFGRELKGEEFTEFQTTVENAFGVEATHRLNRDAVVVSEQLIDPNPQGSDLQEIAKLTCQKRIEVKGDHDRVEATLAQHPETDIFILFKGAGKTDYIDFDKVKAFNFSNLNMILGNLRDIERLHLSEANMPIAQTPSGDVLIQIKSAHGQIQSYLAGLFMQYSTWKSGH